MKSMKVKVTGIWVMTEEIVEVSMARIKRFDNRPALYKAACMTIAKNDFCKKHGFDVQTVGRNYRFNVIA